jgi:hypothetical protein
VAGGEGCAVGNRPGTGRKQGRRGGGRPAAELPPAHVAGGAAEEDEREREPEQDGQARRYSSRAACGFSRARRGYSARFRWQPKKSAVQPGRPPTRPPSAPARRKIAAEARLSAA